MNGIFEALIFLIVPGSILLASLHKTTPLFKTS